MDQSNGFAQLKKKLLEIPKAVKTALPKAVKNTESYLIDLNTSQLSDKGMDSTGSMLPLPYSWVTEQIKKVKGQPIDRITLKDTGRFHSGFTVKYDDTGVEITSSDSKTPKLVKEWGKDIFGLTPDNMKQYQEELLPYLQDELSKFR